MILGTQVETWADESATAAAARRLAALPALADAVLSLDGPLGAGKTTFARHLLRALGAEGRIKSPTFALVEPYSLPGGAVAHMDFYRFEDPQDWEHAGLRDVFAAPGLKLVEWAERAGPLMPPADLTLALRPDAAGPADAPEAAPPRRVTATAHTPCGLALLAAFAASPDRTAQSATAALGGVE